VIDQARARGAELASVEHRWGADDVILYHLALGAGADPLSERELRYAYERELAVLPTFVVSRALDVLAGLDDVPGLEFERAKVLHGEQEIELSAAVPAKGAMRTTGRLSEIEDKGAHALAIVDAESHLDDGTLLARTRFSIVMRDAGGFGGAAANGAHQRRGVPPERAPDVEVTRPILRQQALLYRLTGDKNPLHADPRVAGAAGFDAPILHGLATYGIACKAVVDELLDGDVDRVAGFGARFSGVVFPGETLTVRAWRDDTSIAVEALVAERDSKVLTRSELTLRSAA
jgi:acyl dehydratase